MLLSLSSCRVHRQSVSGLRAVALSSGNNGTYMAVAGLPCRQVHVSSCHCVMRQRFSLHRLPPSRSVRTRHGRICSSACTPYIHTLWVYTLYIPHVPRAAAVLVFCLSGVQYKYTSTSHSRGTPPPPPIPIVFPASPAKVACCERPTCRLLSSAPLCLSHKCSLDGEATPETSHHARAKPKRREPFVTFVPASLSWSAIPRLS